MLLSWLLAAGIAATAQDVIHYSRDNATFLHQVWEFFMHSTLNAPLAEWVPIGNWMEEKAQVLALEENYAFVVDHFCESVNVSSIPNTTGLTLAKRPRWLKVPYVAGCPMNDPSFAEQGQHLMLANGLGCLAPTRCLHKQWLSDLHDYFVAHSKHVTLRDLFFPNEVCNIPFLEKDGARVRPYSSYRFGLYLNSLIEHGTLSKRPRPVMLEVGAGWGAFAAVVKGKFPLTRYVILDIPTSSIFQMGFLHRLGYTKILSLGPNATRRTVHHILCCTDFDFLWIGPQHIELLPDNSVDVAVNFDSMVEMPKASIDLYLHRISHASHAFYHINRQSYTLSLLSPRLKRFMSKAEWNLTYSAENRLHWRAPGARGAYRGIVSGERYTEQYWQRLKAMRESS